MYNTTTRPGRHHVDTSVMICDGVRQLALGHKGNEILDILSPEVEYRIKYYL